MLFNVVFGLRQVTASSRSRCAWMLQGEGTGGGNLSAHAQPDADTIRTLEEAHASKSSSGAGERSGAPSHPQKSWRLHQEQALWLEVKTNARSLHTQL